MSAEPRYYYVDAQNQAAGPVALPGLLALKAAGTVTDTTLVVLEGGSEWVAFSALVATPAPASTPGPAPSPAPAAQAATASAQSPSSSSAVEPLWASQLSFKINQLSEAMDRLVAALEKSRPTFAPAAIPATAALHAEKINLNATPKPGIAASNPAGPAPASPRPGVATTLSPLAVPANAQKSSLPLPALGKAPGPAPAPAKGNIFSKFIKK